jgi:ABC-type nitrate/sulfonate/bicarbonate transport system ATPase subunit
VCGKRYSGFRSAHPGYRSALDALSRGASLHLHEHTTNVERLGDIDLVDLSGAESKRPVELSGGM